MLRIVSTPSFWWYSGNKYRLSNCIHKTSYFKLMTVLPITFAYLHLLSELLKDVDTYAHANVVLTDICVVSLLLTLCSLHLSPV